ncbi:hypothetical protein HEP81_04574 [Streptomyces griseofuscus]|uniref:Uncharacterized protein n=1 Tax=Streptomyces griseofuscus TaxID=146922 RepID=A0A7H1Q3G7_9ACTN|nr:hypothetical protein [Streptomyces griseofuscus]QNT94847.1 hypothetical protein HEP81_04574 [Streptomyces griseofuscus]
MTYEEGTFHEPFGPEYVRPKQADCPNCPCCSAALCERGRADVSRCEGHTSDETRPTVADCPCSAETTPGTMAWHMARIRAVTAAKMKPLDAAAENLLRTVATDQPVTDEAELLPQLTLRRYVELIGGQPRLTQFGRLYLDARVQQWAATAVTVVDVDKKTRMARVVLGRRSGESTVDVPMYQLANSSTGLGADELPGVTLHAYANTAAVHDADVVLLGVSNPRVPAPLYKPGGIVTVPAAPVGPEPAGGEG